MFGLFCSLLQEGQEKNLIASGRRHLPSIHFSALDSWTAIARPTIEEWKSFRGVVLGALRSD
jgi:hypothetical protein